MTLSKPMYSIYRFTYKSCHQKSIFVSKYLKNITSTHNNSIVVYNSLSSEFMNEIEFWNKSIKSNPSTILMVASLRIFKGVYEYIELSRRLPQFSFELVVSASNQEVQNFISKTKPSSNLIVFSQQTNPHPFYQRAKILLQLSHPDLWVETFGLTILEAMVYGIPAIVPNIGGPVELIDDGVNGFTVDPLNIEILVGKVKSLMEDKTLYSKFSNAAIEKSKKFKFDVMINEIENYITV